MLGSRHRESIERCVSNVWFSITADPVINPEGEFKGGVLIISDISDRKRAEEVRQREQLLLQRQAEQLEAAVFERTRQLEESVKSMEGFCYSIAHDLRAPLRAMSGLTTVLIEDYSPALSEEARSVGDRITAAAKRMDRLIEELLAFGRLSNRELPLRAVDVAGAFKAAIHHLSAEIANAHARVDLAEQLGVVWANPTVVEQIASNLLGNALKFVGPGRQPVVRVWAESRGNDLRVWVEDNGIGIEPAYQNKIFGLFERLHTDKQYRGTGIGLAIVQKGVERLGGKVGVESEPGQGSRFWIELPKGEKS
jgi:light-regulated signal transduction histidine kinase (bacteriophytochrome)